MPDVDELPEQRPGAAPEVAVHGTCTDRFEPVRAAFGRVLASGSDLGASVAVTVDGEPVVDLWGGWADADRTVPWQGDTITNVWSTTKTMTALSALVLVDGGELDVHRPVADYWPEFAAAGKHAVEVRHLLAHTSGVAAWEQPVALSDLYDWDHSTARLAAQEPWWEPGSASGYHALSQGHLVGEVVRRVTGQQLGAFFAAEVAGPLGADFHIGLPPEHDDRVAGVVPPPPSDRDASALSPVAVKTFTGPPLDAAAALTEGWRRADIGAANGHGNARSVARLQSVVANGGEVDGIRLLSPRTIGVVFEQQSDGVDLVLGLQLRFGIGYGLPQPATLPYVPEGRVCFWGGWGGSMVVVDTERRVTIAYVMNQMARGLLGSPSAEAVIRAAYRVLDVELPEPV